MGENNEDDENSLLEKKKLLDAELESKKSRLNKLVTDLERMLEAHSLEEVFNEVEHRLHGATKHHSLDVNKDNASKVAFSSEDTISKLFAEIAQCLVENNQIRAAVKNQTENSGLYPDIFIEMKTLAQRLDLPGGLEKIQGSTLLEKAVNYLKSSVLLALVEETKLSNFVKALPSLPAQSPAITTPPTATVATKKDDKEKQSELVPFNVSGYGNNCGLFAMALGIKIALESQSSVSPANKALEFLMSISDASLQHATDNSDEIGCMLRLSLAQALRSDAAIKTRRFETFVSYCSAFLIHADFEKLDPELEALYKANELEMVAMYSIWTKIIVNRGLEQERLDICVQELQSYDISQFIPNCYRQISDLLLKIDPRNSSEIIKTIVQSIAISEDDAVIRLIKLRKLFRAAWVRVNESQANEQQREMFYEAIRRYFNQQYLAQFARQIEEEINANILFLFAAIESMVFDGNGTAKTLVNRDAVIQQCRSLFAELQATHFWETKLYPNYCNYIEKTSAKITADELACLAKYWNVQLSIKMETGIDYKTYIERIPESLHVILTNPSEDHWLVLVDKNSLQQHRLLLASEIKSTRLQPPQLPTATAPSKPVSSVAISSENLKTSPLASEASARSAMQVSISDTRAGAKIQTAVIKTLGKMTIVKPESLAHAEKSEALIKLWNVPAANPNFTGREGLLAELAKRLQQPNETKVKPIVITACHGLGGVGKTQLVTEYIHRHCTDYNMVCWITADNKDQIETAFLELAQDLGITTDKAKPEEIIELVKSWITHHPTCLLVFDNAPNYPTIEKYLPPMGSNVLITSRYTEWLEKGIEVDVFTLEESRDYIRKILGNRAADNSVTIENLANTLGRLPLALAQAAAYIKQNNITIEEYLHLYSEKKQRLLAANALPPSDHHAAVYVTWNITMEVIEARSILAADLLRICAFYHNEDIQHLQLREFSNKNEFNPRGEIFEEALGLLTSYSMIATDVSKHSVYIHQLVQQVIREKLADKASAYLLKAFKATGWLYSSPQQKKDCFLMKSLRAHFEQLLNHFDDFLKSLPKTDTRYDKVEQNILSILHALGTIYFTIGDTSKMEEILKRAYLLDEKYHGEGSDECLSTQAKIATSWHALGKLQDSKKLLENVVASIEARFGLNDTRLVTHLLNLAAINMALGEARKSKDILLRALSLLNSLDAREKSSTIGIILTNLGGALSGLGEHDEAIKIYNKALQEKKAYYGEAHIEVAKTLNAFGCTLMQAGQNEQAVSVLEKALTINQEFYGADHYEVSIVLNNLGMAYQRTNSLGEGRKVLEQVLAMQEKAHALNNKDIAITLTNLGAIYVMMAEYHRGKELLERALALKEVLYGQDNVLATNTMRHLGEALGELGDISGQQRLFERALTIRERHYGSLHIELLEILVCLQNMYEYLGNVKKTGEMLERILAIKEKHYGINHLEVMGTLMDLGLHYWYKAHNIPYAMSLVERAKKIFDDHPASNEKARYAVKNHQILHQLFHGLGSLPQNIVPTSQEEPLTVEQMLKKFLENDSNDWQAWLNLAEYYYQQNNLEEAYKSYLKVASLSLDNIRAISQLARIDCLRDKFSLAQKHYTQAISIKITAQISAEFGFLLFHQGKFAAAIPKFQVAITNDNPSETISYGNLERKLLDPGLQREIDINGTITLRPIYLAYYWLILCRYKLKDTKQCLADLSVFRVLIDRRPEPILVRLLGYLTEQLSDITAIEITPTSTATTAETLPSLTLSIPAIVPAPHPASTHVTSNHDAASIIIQNCQAQEIHATVAVFVQEINLKIIKTVSADRSEVFRHLYNIPIKNPAHINRPALCQQIATCMKPMAVCVGMPGGGKTTLVTEFIYNNLTVYQDIFYFDAESEIKLEDAFVKLAKNLALQYDNEKQAIAALKSWFAKRTNCLIVYNNVLEFSVIENYLQHSNVKVLVTSRHTDWPYPDNIITVGVFNAAESIDCIQKYLSHREVDSVDQIQKLGDHFEHLPFALLQAAAYIRRNQITIPRYLELYRQHTINLLSGGDTRILPADYHGEPLYRLWDNTLDKLKSISSLAIHVLNFCAWLNSVPILKNLLNKLSENIEINHAKESLIEVLGLVARHSLIAFQSESAITLHKVLQEVLWFRQSSADKVFYTKVIQDSLHGIFAELSIMNSNAQQEIMLKHLEMYVSRLEHWILSLNDEEKENAVEDYIIPTLLLLSNNYAAMMQDNKKTAIEKRLLELQRTARMTERPKQTTRSHYFILMQKALAMLQSTALPETWGTDSQLLRFLKHKLRDRTDVVVCRYIWNLMPSQEEQEIELEDIHFPLIQCLQQFIFNSNVKKFVLPLLLNQAHFAGMIFVKNQKAAKFEIAYINPTGSNPPSSGEDNETIVKIKTEVNDTLISALNRIRYCSSAKIYRDDEVGEISIEQIKLIKANYSQELTVDHINLIILSDKQQINGCDCAYIVGQSLAELASDQPLSIRRFDQRYPQSSIQAIAEARTDFCNPRLVGDLNAEHEVRGQLYSRLARALVENDSHARELREFIKTIPDDTNVFDTRIIMVLKPLVQRIDLKDKFVKTPGLLFADKIINYLISASILNKVDNLALKKFCDWLLEPFFPEYGDVIFRLDNNHRNKSASQQQSIIVTKPSPSTLTTALPQEKVQLTSQQKEAQPLTDTNDSYLQKKNETSSSPHVIIEESEAGKNIQALVGAAHKKLQIVKTEASATQEKREHLTRLWNLPQRNPHFTGREGLLNALATRLPESNESKVKPVVITACHGLGGVGKTQLAIEFACRHSKEYAVICWIPAETAEQIEVAYLELAQDLNIAPESAKSEAVIQIVKTWLVNHPQSLLIFDNAPNYQALEKYLPQTGCHVLITSRYTDWLEKGIEVDVFTPEEAHDYVIKILGVRAGDQRETINELAEMIGRLPLALAQAVAYIKQNNLQLQDYITMYQEKKAYFLSKEMLPPGDHHAAVYVAWDLTVAAIQIKSQLAPKLLNICSCLNHDAIPVSVFKNFSNDINHNCKKETIEEALGLLHSYSMLSVNASSQAVSLHQLVQEVTREKLGLIEAYQYLLITEQSLIAIFPYLQDQMTDYSFKKLLIPHIKQGIALFDEYNKKLLAISHQTNEQRKAVEMEVLLKLLVLIAEAYGNLSNSIEQKKILKRILAIKEKHFGVDFEGNVPTLNDLAYVYGSLSNPAKKRKLLEKAVLIEKAHRGNTHLGYAKLLANLADSCGVLGDLQKQQEYLETALTIKEKVLGKDHLEYAVTLSNLANVYGFQGKHFLKREVLEAALPVIQSCLGDKHVKVCRVLHNLANAYGELGDIPKKKAILEFILPIYEEHYGKDHFEVSLIINDLAPCHGQLGDPAQQKALAERALRIKEQYYGENNIESASVLINLAGAYSALGQFAKAQEILEKALAMCIARYGENHLETARVLDKLGVVYAERHLQSQEQVTLHRALKIKQHLKDTEEEAQTLTIMSSSPHLSAKPQVRKLLYDQILTLNQNHPFKNKVILAKTLSNLACMCSDLGDHSQQKALLKQAIQIMSENYSSNHITVMEITTNLANAEGSLGNHTKKIELLEKAMTPLEAYHGCNSIEVAKTKCNLANAYGHMRNFAKKKELLLSALTIQESALIKNPIEIETTRFNLGIVYWQEGELELALSVLKQIYNVIVNHPGCGTQHPFTQKTASVINELQQKITQVKQQRTAQGSSHGTQKPIQKVPDKLSILQQQLVSQKIPDGLAPKDENNTQAWVTLANKYYQQANLDQTIRCYNTVLKLQPHDAYACHNIACLYHAQGNLQLASAHFRNALEIKARNSTRCDYGMLLQRTNRHTQALEEFLTTLVLEDDGSRLSYGKLEGKLLDENLQQEITDSTDLTIEPFYIANYWLITCFLQLGDAELAEFSLAKLVALTEKLPTPLHFRLLSYAYRCMKNGDKTDECLAIALSIDEQVTFTAEQANQALKGLHLFQGYVDRLIALVATTSTGIRYTLLAMLYRLCKEEEKAQECDGFALSLSAVESPISKEVASKQQEIKQAETKQQETKHEIQIPRVLIEESQAEKNIQALVGAAHKKLQIVKTEASATQEKREHLTRLWNLPQRNPHFTGREGLLNSLAARLLQAKDTKLKPVVITACHGLGGVGKTQLAVEFACRHSKEYAAICWIPAETTEQIEAAYLALAQDLNIAPENAKPEEVIQLVKTWLMNHPQSLLIFDNAPNYQVVEKYLPQTGCHVLITSRYTDWLEKGIEVDVFTPEESYDYVIKILGVRAGDKREAINELAALMGRLPLALAQAVAYIKQNNLGIDEYIRLYQERKTYFLAKEILPAGDHHAAVAVTWNITLELLRSKSKLAPELLYACAYLSSENIPGYLLKLFSDSTKNNPTSEIYEEIIGLLSNYSMLQMNLKNNYVGLHRLVQEVIRHQLMKEGKIFDHIINMVQAMKKVYPYGVDRETMADHTQRQELHQHLAELLKHLDERIKPSATLDDAAKTNLARLQVDVVLVVILFLADSLEDRGNQHLRRDLLMRALVLFTLYRSEDHIDALKTVIALANTHINLGEVRKAKQMLEETLPKLIACFGDNHIEVARPLCVLGNVCGTLGEFEEKRKCFTRALAIFNKIYGETHESVAKAQASLGIAYGDLGNLPKQLELQETSLRTYMRLYGKSHIEIARGFNNLGTIQMDMGNFDKAKLVLEKALTMFESFFGPDHVEVGRTALNLGNVYGELNMLDKQDESLRRSLKIFRANYGENHVEVGRGIGSIANALAKRGKLNESNQLFDQALNIFQAFFGKANIEAAMTLLNMSSNYGELKDHVTQRKLLDRALQTYNQIDKNHPQIATVLFGLGMCCLDQEDIDQGYPYIQSAHKFCLSHPSIGANHPLTAQVKEVLSRFSIVDLGPATPASAARASAQSPRLSDLDFNPSLFGPPQRGSQPSSTNNDSNRSAGPKDSPSQAQKKP